MTCESTCADQRSVTSRSLSVEKINKQTLYRLGTKRSFNQQKNHREADLFNSQPEATLYKPIIMMMRARDRESSSLARRPNHRSLTPVIPYHHFQHVRNAVVRLFFPLFFYS